MKTILSARRVAFLSLALASAGVTAAFAQTTSTTTPTSTTATCSGRHHHDSVLTVAEKAQLRKARETVLAANPGLQTQRASLRQQFQSLRSQGTSATPAEWAALRQQKQALRGQVRAAELSVDPTLAPIFAKLDAAHPHHST